MPNLRIERVPVQSFYLGLLGFDHLQLVLQQSELDGAAPQDGWYVVEGVRDTSGPVTVLGADGGDGITTLSEANNGLAGESLVAAIGDPEDRGSRVLLSGAAAVSAWEVMAGRAADIDVQHLPYSAFGSNGSVTITLNSTSLVSTLLHAAGLDVAASLPAGLRFSPGFGTLIGTSGGDILQTVDNFFSLAGGTGNDTLSGSSAVLTIEKLYGGTGDDTFMWSNGVNIYHGGQTGLAYAEDGSDMVDYTGIGFVTITHNDSAFPHKTPDFFAVHAGGIDSLFSIERLKWDKTSDQVVMGHGADVIPYKMLFDLDGEDAAGQGDIFSFNGSGSGLVINASNEDYVFVQGNETADDVTGLWLKSAEWLAGSGGDDLIYAGTGQRGIEGNAGNDIIDGREAVAFSGQSPLGYDLEIQGGAGNDLIVSGAGRTIASGGDGADRFVLSALTAAAGMVEFVIEDAGADDRVYVPYAFLNESGAGFEGSALMPLLGAFVQFPGENSFEDLPENLGPWAGGPDGRSDFFRFEWQLQAQTFYGSDQTEGVFDMAGNVFYNRDGGDLLIHVFAGEGVEFTELGNDDALWTHIISSFIPETETIIRIVDFEAGDLGIAFYDPGTPSHLNIVTDHGEYTVNDYPNWDSAVLAMTNGGVMGEALDLRPDAPDYVPPDTENTPPPAFVVGTADGDDISVATGTANVDGGGGNDEIDTAAGNDTIDGGSGDDTLRGGTGNDIYVVDSAADSVIESARSGFDTVRSSVDYTLGANVEYLELTGTAVEGTGNAFANAISGNDGGNLLRGEGGADQLFGAGGNDTLMGGSGSDGYFYSAGDGNDIIVDLGDAAATDRLLLSGIATGDVGFLKLASDSGDLIAVFEQGGRIVLDGFYAAAGNGIDAIEFEDQVRWSRQEIETRAAAVPVVTNAAPGAVADLDYAIRAGSTLVPGAALLANDSDIEGDALTITSTVSNTAGVAVTLEAGGIRVTTPPLFAGLVSFTYTITDSAGGTDTARVELEVLPNSAPVTAGSIPPATVPAGALYSLTLPAGLFTDPDNDPLSITAALAGGAPLPPWLVFDAVSRTLEGTPPAGFAVALDIVFTATDGAASADASFALTVQPGNRAPVAADDTGFGVETGAVLRIDPADLTINDADPDGDALTIVAVGQAQHGSIALEPGGIAVFTAEGGYAGPASFSYTVSDGQGGTSSATVTLAVTAPPVYNIVTGTAADDTLSGGNLADRIEGLAGNDVMRGRGGNDVFVVSGTNTGFDTFIGGAGFDGIVGSAGDDVIGRARSASAFSGIEYISAGDGFDVLRLGGSAATENNSLNLSAIVVSGLELIDAGAGNDNIKGSAAADTILGSLGNDILNGGGGNDVFLVTGALDGFDVFIGGDGDDAVRGSDGDDVIGLRFNAANLSGIETIDGGQGFDLLKLSAGSDTVDLSTITLAGIERISAGNGNDRVVLSSANDEIEGGNGRDTFVFVAGFGHDTILDFKIGTARVPVQDVIDLSALELGSFQDLIALAAQDGAGTVIAVSPSDSIRLSNVLLTSLKADDFVLA